MCEPFPTDNPVQHLVHEWEHGAMSRRDFFERALYIFGTVAAAEALLAACSPAPAATPTSAPAAAATTAPAAAPTTAPAATTAPTVAPTVAATGAPAVTATRPPAPTTPPVTPPPLTTVPGYVDPSAVDATMVTFMNGDVQIMAHQAKPTTGGPWPAVIVIHENQGLTEHIMDVTRRIANLGYVALGVDYLSRSGGTGKFGPPNSPTTAINALKQTDIDSDTVAAATYLKGLSFVKPKIGIVGFCWGGANSLRGAIATPLINASVIFYGFPIANMDDVQKINGSVIGSYGSLDTGTVSGIPALEAAMKKYNKPFEYKIYDGANHSFFNNTGPRYNEAAAKDAWARLVDFYKKTLSA